MIVNNIPNKKNQVRKTITNYVKRYLETSIENNHDRNFEIIRQKSHEKIQGTQLHNKSSYDNKWWQANACKIVEYVMTKNSNTA